MASGRNTSKHVAVIHLGSQKMDYGLVGGNEPDCKRERSLVAHPRAGSFATHDSQTSYCGDKAWTFRKSLKVSWPIERGVVGDDKDADAHQLLRHCFSRSARFLDDVPTMFMTEDHTISDEKRSTLGEFAFEELQVPAFASANAQQLALHSQGLSSGLVIDIGLSVTRLVPIYNNSVVKAAINELEVGGDHMTRQLMRQLSESGWSLAGAQDTFETINEMKESLCYVAAKYQYELELAKATPKAIERTWKTFNVGAPRFICTEVLFSPSLANLDALGLPQLAVNSIHRCPNSSAVAKNIVLSGGAALIEGLNTRIGSELQLELSGKSVDVAVAEMAGASAAWLGARKIALDRSQLSELCVTRQQFDEVGPNAFRI